MTIPTALALILDHKPDLWDDPDYQSRFKFGCDPRESHGVLPIGIKTEADRVHLVMLFVSLNNAMGIQAKRAILETKDGRAGLAIWKRWVTYYWLPKINAIIERVLDEEGLHPKTLIADEKLTEFPSGAPYVHMASIAMANALFGGRFLTAAGLVPTAMTDVVAAFGIHNWDRIRKQYKRVEAKYPSVKAEFEDMKKSKSSHFLELPQLN